MQTTLQNLANSFNQIVFHKQTKQNSFIFTYDKATHYKQDLWDIYVKNRKT